MTGPNKFAVGVIGMVAVLSAAFVILVEGSKSTFMATKLL